MKSLHRFIDLPLYRYIYAFILGLILKLRNDPASLPTVCQCSYCGQNLTRHEIGVLYASVARIQSRTPHRFWRAKLTMQELELIRQSQEPIRKLAEKYNVSFQTIWRVKKNLSYKSQNELNCPRCRHELTTKEVARLFAKLGTSVRSRRKVKTSITNGRKNSKLTEEDVANVRKSSAPTNELARQQGVHPQTIRKIRRNRSWKPLPLE
jgi:hypothetical protein